MTQRTFRNPQGDGGHDVHVHTAAGVVVIAPGQTAQIEMPRITMYARDGAELGSVDQPCPDLLVEVNAPGGLVFELPAASPSPTPPVAAPSRPTPTTAATAEPAGEAEE